MARFRVWMVVDFDGEKSHFLAAEKIPGDHVTPFLLGLFCGNQDVGSYIKREHASLTLTRTENGLQFYRASVQEKHYEAYHDPTVYMDFIVQEVSEDETVD